MNVQTRRPLTHSINVRCRVADGRSYTLLLLKLSRSGCSMEPLGQAPEASQDAQLQLPGLSFLPGRITRSSPTEVRLEFDHPIYPPIFEDLKARLLR